MLSKIIRFSIHNKVIVSAFVIGIVVWGLYAVQRLPLDAIPDVTNNQVNVVTIAPNLAPVEMEQYVTYPIEMAVANIQGLENVRSVSQFGLSIVTLEFKEQIDNYWARSQVNERLQAVKADIPPGFGQPELLPITTGLGEIFQYVIKPKDPKDTSWRLSDLRTLQDWTVKRQLLGTEGVAEISSFGGHLKQHHIRVSPEKLKSMGVTLDEVYQAVAAGNGNTGAAYIEKNNQQYFIRGIGMAKTPADLALTFIKMNGSVPVKVGDIADIEEGHAIRFGALTQGNHEAVGGIILMLKGENSRVVIDRVKEKLKTIEKSLPEGLVIEPFLDRELLIDRAIATVVKNLVEGGVIVIFVLLLLLGNFRAGLLIASIIPLAMLFTVALMVAFGVSGNLMSLGAIDFGLIVDGAVIIVENVIHHFQKQRQRTQNSDDTVYHATTEIMQSAVFGAVIIMIVYVPILLLTGIEGKMFRPMAITVIFALLGAFILSLTYVPMMAALFLQKSVSHKETFADRWVNQLKTRYQRLLTRALRLKKQIIIGGVIAFIGAAALFSRMGGEFIPQLDEGDYVVQINMLPGTALSQMTDMGKIVGQKVTETFPHEIALATGKIGTSEIPMDPMSVEEMDLVLTMHPKEEWQKCHSKADFEAQLDSLLQTIPGCVTSIQQPIAMRFNELMTGAKTDVIVKVLGSDLEKLAEIANQIERKIQTVPGVADLYVAKAEGMPQLFITYKRDMMAQYGFSVEQVSQVLRMALAGEKAGVLYEDNRRFDVVVKLNQPTQPSLDVIGDVVVTNAQGLQMPLRNLATIAIEMGPMAVNRERGERNVNVNLNVRARDVASVVGDIQAIVSKDIKLPMGYQVTYGGQFENLESAKKRLLLVVPAALALILLLLYLSFKDIKASLIIFSAIPFAAIGGVVALWLRSMPFSISAGVGFIALFGVAVLNGLVLIGHFQTMRQAATANVHFYVLRGALDRFRPVLMTALVASLGFLPMALATGGGAEVQKPLATVVIGGLMTSTVLTLVVLPILYALFYRTKAKNDSEL